MSTSLLVPAVGAAVVAALIIGNQAREADDTHEELKSLRRQLENSRLASDKEREKMNAALQQAQDEVAKLSEEEKQHRLKEEAEKLEKLLRENADTSAKEEWADAKDNYFLHGMSDCPSWGANNVCCDRKIKDDSKTCSLFQPSRIDTQYIPNQGKSFDMLCRKFSDSETSTLKKAQNAAPETLPNEITLSNKSSNISNVCHAVASSSCPINLYFVDKISARISVNGDCSNTLASMLALRRADMVGLRSPLHALVSCPVRNKMIMTSDSITKYEKITNVCDISSGFYKVQFDIDRDSGSINATTCSSNGHTCDGKCFQTQAMKTFLDSPYLLTSSISSNVERDNVWRKVLGDASLQNHCMPDQVSDSPATCTYEISNLRIDAKPGSKMSEIFPNNNPACYKLVT